MANGLLSWRNKVDLSGATLSAGSEASNLPVSHLADATVAKVWRTSGTTSTYFEVDFGVDVPIRQLALVGTDIGDTDTVRHRLSSSGGGPTAGDKLDTGSLNAEVEEGYGYHAYTLSAEVTGVRYWRVDITASSLSSQGYFEVGRAWAGPGLQPAINFSFGASLQWEDAATVNTAQRSGVEFVDETYTRRYRQFQYRTLTDAEANSAEDLHREAGRRNQVLFVPDPDASDVQRKVILGRLEAISPIEFGGRHPNYNATAFQIRESK